MYLIIIILVTIVLSFECRPNFILLLPFIVKFMKSSEAFGNE